VVRKEREGMGFIELRRSVCSGANNAVKSKKCFYAA